MLLNCTLGVAAVGWSLETKSEKALHLLPVGVDIPFLCAYFPPAEAENRYAYTTTTTTTTAGESGLTASVTSPGSDTVGYFQRRAGCSALL